MLQHIDSSNREVAVDLLAKGFTGRSRAFWSESLARLDAFGGNAAAGVPTGQLLMDGSRAVGVVLTPASVRIRKNGTRERLVNISSLYVEPEHRWRTPVMFRSAVKDRECAYLDLTASDEVRKMLPAFGFQPITTGLRIGFLPLLAAVRAGSAGARMVPLEGAPASSVPAPQRALLDAHRAFNCHAAALYAEGQWHALLFKPRRLRGMPAATLVYCESLSALSRNIGTVARYLARRGKLVLLADSQGGSARAFLDFPGRAVKFAKGGTFENRIDYAGSELSLFDM